MAQEADVALYRVQEQALLTKRWKLNRNANARRTRASRTRFAAMRQIARRGGSRAVARSDVKFGAGLFKA